MVCNSFTIKITIDCDDSGALLIAGHFAIPEVTLYFANKLLRGNRSIKVG